MVLNALESIITTVTGPVDIQSDHEEAEDCPESKLGPKKVDVLCSLVFLGGFIVSFLKTTSPDFYATDVRQEFLTRIIPGVKQVHIYEF